MVGVGTGECQAFYFQWGRGDGCGRVGKHSFCSENGQEARMSGELLEKLTLQFMYSFKFFHVAYLRGLISFL